MATVCNNYSDAIITLHNKYSDNDNNDKGNKIYIDLCVCIQLCIDRHIYIYSPPGGSSRSTRCSGSTGSCGSP